MDAARLNSLVWSNADDAAYGSFRPEGYPSFLSADQAATCERARQARMLYRGKHRQYFLAEGRTQTDFKEVLVEGRLTRPYYSLNVLRLISRKTADLLFGEDPELKVDDAIQQAKLAELSERTALSAMFKDAAIMASWAGQVCLEACVHDGQVYLQAVAPDEIFPLGPLLPNRQYGAYVRYQTRAVGPKEQPAVLLLETRYERGVNRREVWRIVDGEKRERLGAEKWAELTGDAAIREEERTGVDRPTVEWVPNELDEGVPISDYDGLVNSQDLLNAKQTQIAIVFHQHSDPAMAFPSELFDDEGNIRSRYKAFAMAADGRKPEYIVYEAKLDQAMKDRSFTLSTMLIMAEMSPVLLGLKEGAAPDAYKKVRLEAMNSLAMAGRKAKTWRPAIRRAIDLAQALEQSIPGNRYDRLPIGVNLRDGIPVDEGEQAETIATLVGANVMSRRRAVSILIPDQAGQEQELAELERAAAAAAAAATPTVLLDEPGDPAGGGAAATDTPAAGGENQSDAVATNDLRATVGGSVAVRELQKLYYEGAIPRAAAIANLVNIFGFSQDEAESLLPPEKAGELRPAAAAPAKPLAIAGAGQ